MNASIGRINGEEGMKSNNYTLSIVVALSIVAAFFTYFPLTNTDIWWHLATAREMISRNNFLYVDPFSFTLNNPEWINLHWFFQLVAYGIYNFTGAGGLVLVKCLTIFGICLFLSLTFNNKAYMISTATIFALLIFCGRFLVLARPIVITLISIAIFICFFERFLITRKVRYILLLLPLQIIWTNSQGLFILGPVIAGCYFAGETFTNIINRKIIPPPKQSTIKEIIPFELLIFFLLIICSCLLNTYGWHGLLFPFKLLGRIDPSQANIYARNISENMPLFKLTGKDIYYVYAVIGATVIVLLSFLINIRSLRWSHILLFGIFFSLTVMAKRNIILYFTVIPPIIGYNYSVGVKDSGQKGVLRKLLVQQNRSTKIGISGAVAIILIFTIFLHGCAITKFPKKNVLSPFRVPIGAGKFLKAHPVKGRMFNSIRYGGYLMWHLYPGKKVYIDGRLIIRPPGYFAEYLSLLDDPSTFPQAANTYNITHVILPTAIFYRSMPLVKWLYWSPEWEMVFADGNSVVFVQNRANKYKELRFENSQDNVYIRNNINQIWKDDHFIMDEAHLYLSSLIEYINK